MLAVVVGLQFVFINVAGDTPGCSFDCCGLPHLEHIGGRSGILDIQVHVKQGDIRSLLLTVLGHNL